MPASKKSKAKKPAKSELTIAREKAARYSGLVSRICSFHQLGGESDIERFDLVADLYAKKEKEKRERKPAF